MDQQNIQRLKKLDPNQLNGTIQNVLMRGDLHTVSFADACYWILSRELEFKDTLQKENDKMRKILEKNGLYTSENMFGEV